MIDVGIRSARKRKRRREGEEEREWNDERGWEKEWIRPDSILKSPPIVSTLHAQGQEAKGAFIYMPFVAS